jgi:hypothetical protein
MSFFALASTEVAPSCGYQMAPVNTTRLLALFVLTLHIRFGRLHPSGHQPLTPNP